MTRSHCQYYSTHFERFIRTGTRLAWRSLRDRSENQTASSPRFSITVSHHCADPCKTRAVFQYFCYCAGSQQVKMLHLYKTVTCPPTSYAVQHLTAKPRMILSVLFCTTYNMKRLEGPHILTPVVRMSLLQSKSTSYGKHKPVIPCTLTPHSRALPIGMISLLESPTS